MTTYYVNKDDMSEWRSICRAYARKVGAELLFVNENSFGIQTKDGQLQHIDISELYDILARA